MNFNQHRIQIRKMVFFDKCDLIKRLPGSQKAKLTDQATDGNGAAATTG